MSTEQYNNLAVSTTTGTVNNSSNPVTFSVQTGDGALFPTTTNGPFRVTVSNIDGTNAEVMLCTSRSSDSLTCSRGSSATNEVPTPTLLTHSTGSTVGGDITSGAVISIRNEIHQFGTRASLPTTAGQTIGNTYHCTDSPYEFIFDGSVWQPYIFGYNVTEPILGNFTQVKVDLTTFDTSHGGIVFTCTSNGGSEDFQYICQAIPGSGAYFVDTAFYIMQNGAVGGAGAGLSAGTSTSSNLVTSSHGLDSGFGTEYINKLYNNPTSLNANRASQALHIISPLIWSRYKDDRTTNRSAYTSINGQTWFQMPSTQESRTTLFTPAQGTFGVTPFNSNMQVHLVHFSIHA